MNRRQFVKASSGLIAVSSAGCLGILDRSESDFDTVKKWLPNPRSIDTDLDHYETNSISPSLIQETTGDVLVADTVSPDVDWGSLPAGDVDLALQADLSTQGNNRTVRIFEGNFDSDWIGSLLSRDEYIHDRTYEDYTLYRPDDGEQLIYAISDDAVIRAVDSSESPEPEFVAQVVIDAEQGERDRYHEANSDMAALTGRMDFSGMAHLKTHERVEDDNIELGRFRNLVGYGTSFEIGEKLTDVTEVFIFLSDNDIVERDIQQYIDEGVDLSRFRKEPEFEIDERAVLVKGSIPTSDVLRRAPI